MLLGKMLDKYIESQVFGIEMGEFRVYFKGF
jgi:hypothetical protein